MDNKDFDPDVYAKKLQTAKTPDADVTPSAKKTSFDPDVYAKKLQAIATPQQSQPVQNQQVMPTSDNQQEPAGLMDMFASGAEQGAVGLPGAVLKGVGGAFTGDGALNRTSKAIDYAFDPSHTVYASTLGKNKDFSQPSGAGQIANIAGQIAGGLPSLLIPGLGEANEGSILAHAGGLLKKSLGGIAHGAVSAGGGAVAGTGASAAAGALADKYSPDMDPQARADLQNIAGAVGGITGGAATNGATKVLAPKNANVLMAKDTNTILGNQPGKDLLQGQEPNLQTPTATPKQTLEQTEGNIVTPQRRMNDLIQNTVGNAKQMYNDKYNQTTNTIGNNLMQPNQDILKQVDALGQMDTGLFNNEHQTEDVRSFKNSLDAFKGQLSNSLTNQMPYSAIVGFKSQLNSLERSLNLVNLPPVLKQQLKGYRQILDDTVQDHLSQGENSGQYAPGSLQNYQDANYLYSKTKNATETSPHLDPNGAVDDTQKDKIKSSTPSALQTGGPQGLLENVTRAMQDVAGRSSSPEDAQYTANNVQNINNLHQMALKQAISKGGDAALNVNQGLLEQRDRLNDNPNSPNNVQSDPIIAPQSLANTVQSHIDNLFGQGAEKGIYTPSRMTNALKEMSNLHDTLVNNDTASGLNQTPQGQQVIQTLKQGKALNDIIATGDANDVFRGELNRAASAFDPNSPNAATQAGTILSHLTDISGRINAVRSRLGLPPPSIAGHLANTVVNTKLMGMFNLLRNGRQVDAARQSNLNNIQQNLTSPGGRAQLLDQLNNAQSTLKNNAIINSRLLKGSALRGGAAGVAAGGTQQ